MVVLPKVVRFVYEWYATVTKKEAPVELFVFFLFIFGKNSCFPFPHPHQSDFVNNKHVILKT